MNLEYAKLTDCGLRASENQDSVFCAAEKGTGLFAVADGMGGHFNGSYASNAVKDALAVWWKDNPAIGSDTKEYFETVDSIKEAVSDVNERIRNSFSPDTICGTTLVALWVKGNTFSVISCGDSRCYLMKHHMLKSELSCLTLDDTWDNEADSTHGMSPDEIKNSNNYGKLVRAVGTENRLYCSEKSDRLFPGSLFFLCSDGFYKYTDGKTIKKMLEKASRPSSSLERCLKELKEEIYKNGAPDNMSGVLVRVR